MLTIFAFIAMLLIIISPFVEHILTFIYHEKHFALNISSVHLTSGMLGRVHLQESFSIRTHCEPEADQFSRP